MKAFILAAGLGTRLRPWTEKHPKALVPVGGVPMLERVLLKLESEGFDRIVINVHHFAGQIVDFLDAYHTEAQISVSDESEKLLDTGGGLVNASAMLGEDPEPFLVHNVDILSDAPLAEIMALHKQSGRDVSLVTSPRDSSRKLCFDNEGILRGWHHLGTGEYRPAGYQPGCDVEQHAFSGIYVMNPEVLDAMEKYSEQVGTAKFPVMDWFLHNASLSNADPCKKNIGEIKLEKLNLIDIGKPDTLSQAQDIFKRAGLDAR